MFVEKSPAKLKIVWWPLILQTYLLLPDVNNIILYPSDLIIPRFWTVAYGKHTVA